MNTGEAISAPRIVDAAAWERFVTLASAMGLKADDPWVGGYVAYEWAHGRHLFQAYAPDVTARRVLEFGCNVGASGIVLAHLGAEVTGVDIDPQVTALAEVNGRAHGLGDRIRILCLGDTRSMPFPERHFDLIVCNSVLEYVPPAMLSAIQAELMRVLAPGGLVLVLGTSNRLWPKEVHSGRWISNYLPRAVDALLGPRQRGISPFTVRGGFSECALVDREDNGSAYLAARRRMGTSEKVLAVMRLAAGLLHPVGLTVGMLMPSFSLVLRRSPA